LDVVQLKSSGPNMTVQDVSDKGVICWWFDSTDKLHEKMFPKEVLDKSSNGVLDKAKTAAPQIIIDMD
jgi:uncharacterized protein YodC (DUF2158 family)